MSQSADTVCRHGGVCFTGLDANPGHVGHEFPKAGRSSSMPAAWQSPTAGGSCKEGKQRAAPGA